MQVSQIEYRPRRHGAPQARARLEKQRILDEAYGMVCEGDLSSLSMDALCARLRTRPGRIARLFGGVEQVREIVAVRALTELTELLADATAHRAAREGLAAFADGLRLFAEARGSLYRAAVAALGLCSEPARAQQAAFERVEGAVLGGYALCGVAMQRMRWCLRAAIQGAIAQEAPRGVGPDCDELFDFLVAMLDAQARAAAVGSRPPRLHG